MGSDTRETQAERVARIRDLCEKAEANGEKQMFLTVPFRPSHRKARTTFVGPGLRARIVGSGPDRTVVMPRVDKHPTEPKTLWEAA